MGVGVGVVIVNAKLGGAGLAGEAGRDKPGGMRGVMGLSVLDTVMQGV